MVHQRDLSSNKLVRLVEAILAKSARNSGPITMDGDLVGIGLTSVDMVSLMLDVEAEFDVMIPATDITPQNFRSIAAINALVSRLEGSSAPP
jgi:acyl carrier protein